MWLPARFRSADDESNGRGANEIARIEGRVAARQPSVLAITSDDRLYYLLLSASIDLGWKITRARTIERALELGCSQPTPLVIYDERLPGAEWREALPGLTGFPDQPAVLLAASEVSEEIWESLLRCRGYDLVLRAAGSEEWKRELRFAWLATANPPGSRMRRDQRP
jgi:hypothetical protein